MIVAALHEVTAFLWLYLIFMATLLIVPTVGLGVLLLLAAVAVLAPPLFIAFIMMLVLVLPAAPGSTLAPVSALMIKPPVAPAVPTMLFVPFVSILALRLVLIPPAAASTALLSGLSTAR